MNWVAVSATLYDRVLQLKNQLATAVSLHTQKKALCAHHSFNLGSSQWALLINWTTMPPAQQPQVLSMAHGFVFSSAQHMEQPREAIKLPGPDTRQCHSLPESSTTVPAVALMENTTKVPKLTSAAQSKPDTVAAGIPEEQQWPRQLLELLNKEKLEKGDANPWSACHVALQASGRCILINW